MWPKNVPANVRHGQVWIVEVNEGPTTTFEKVKQRTFLTLMATKPTGWPGDVRIVRSRLALGDVDKLGIQGAVANMHWLLDNFMRHSDWAHNLGEHQGRLIKYLHPFEMQA